MEILWKSPFGLKQKESLATEVPVIIIHGSSQSCAFWGSTFGNPDESFLNPLAKYSYYSPAFSKSLSCRGTFRQCAEVLWSKVYVVSTFSLL